MPERDQELATKYYNRGIAHSRKGELKLAIENYTQAIELDPNNSDAYYSRGGAWLRLGEQDKAKADLETARNLGNDALTTLDKILQNHDRAWKVLGNLLES